MSGKHADGSPDLMGNGHCRLWTFATTRALPMRCRSPRNFMTPFLEVPVYKRKWKISQKVLM